MELTVAHESSTPPYLQVATHVARDVRRGTFAPGERLPAASVLASRVGVDRNTVLRAYRELAAVGLLVVKQGSGTFVSEDAIGGVDDDPKAKAVFALRLERCVGSARRLGLDDESIVAAMRSALRRAASPSSFLALALGSPKTADESGQPLATVSG